MRRRKSLFDRLDRSVRIKLLALVLAPLLIGVPVLLGLVWTWGNQAYHRLLSFKFGSDLVTAHEYFDRVQQGVGTDIQALANSVPVGTLLDRAEAPSTADALHGMAVARGLDFLHLLDRDGKPLASAGGRHLPPISRASWTVVDSATGDAPRTSGTTT